MESPPVGRSSSSGFGGGMWSGGVFHPSASQDYVAFYPAVQWGEAEKHSIPLPPWTSLHPHGFIVIQQETWQVRNGEEEGRCTEGGREAEKLEEDRRICSKQAS